MRHTHTHTHTHTAGGSIIIITPSTLCHAVRNLYALGKIE